MRVLLPGVLILVLVSGGGSTLTDHPVDASTSDPTAMAGKTGPAAVRAASLSRRDDLLAAPQNGYGFLWGYEDDGERPVISYEKAEFAFARLQYDPVAAGYGGGFRRRRLGGMWPTDYPKADRTYLKLLHRLTRVNTRQFEWVVNLNDDAVYNSPFLYAVEVEDWTFTPAQAAKLRDYLLKGGFLMVDDFHGTQQWDSFMRGLRLVFPDRPVEPLANGDEIFHVLYDLEEKFQVPGAQFLRSGRTYEQDGYAPQWRAVRADDGRILVAICHNMDLGDAWEWADVPEYPEKYVGLAARLGVNYALYAMTH
jgi:hypothetical protein